MESDKHRPDWPHMASERGLRAISTPSRRSCEWAGFHLINMILLNEPHVLIKGFLHNHLKSFGEWEKSIVLVYYFGSSVRVSTASDGNTGLWMGPFDRLLFVSEERRLHVYLITHEFNKHVSMFKETDKVPFVSRTCRPRSIRLTLKTRRKKKSHFILFRKQEPSLQKVLFKEASHNLFPKSWIGFRHLKQLKVNLLTKWPFLFKEKKMNLFPCQHDNNSNWWLYEQWRDYLEGKYKFNSYVMLRAPTFCGGITLREIKLKSWRSKATKWPSIDILQEWVAM